MSRLSTKIYKMLIFKQMVDLTITYLLGQTQKKKPKNLTCGVVRPFLGYTEVAINNIDTSRTLR